MSYYVASKIMGGDWRNYSTEEGIVHYTLLESALCQAAMLQSKIREALVFSVTPIVLTDDAGDTCTAYHYEQVAYYPYL